MCVYVYVCVYVSIHVLVMAYTSYTCNGTRTAYWIKNARCLASPWGTLSNEI